MSTIEQITLTNCGPIQHVSIPCPGPGKIVVLSGRNGCGKTTALEHLETAMNGRGKGNIRDGANSGAVEAFGVTLKLGRSTRRSGDLAVESLDGKFNISDLIDPGIKDPKAADATRIKALVQMANVLPCPDLFYDLVGGREELERVAGRTALESDDLVTMAERIKRDLEAAARREEDQASHAEGRARGAKEAAGAVDVNAECEAAKLTEALNTAIREEARIKAEQEAAAKARRAAQLAQDQLEDAEAAYTGPALAAAITTEERAKAMQADAEKPVKELTEQLQAAQKAHELDKQKLDFCETTARSLRTREGKAKAAFDEAKAKVVSLKEQLRLAEEAAVSAGKLLTDVAAESEEAARQAVDADAKETQSRQLVADCDSNLRLAKQANELACQAVANAVAARKAAEAHESSMTQWRRQVAEALPAEPAPELLAAATQRVAECNAACERGALIRQANQHLAEAEKHLATANTHRKAADKLRDAAKGTDDVLSEVVAKSGSQLRVEQGRLVLDTEKRGKTFFHELSAGERARIAIDIGIDAMPESKQGVIILGQELWEGLDEINREAIQEHLANKPVGLMTAEAGIEEQITPRVYESQLAEGVLR